MVAKLTPIKASGIKSGKMLDKIRDAMKEQGEEIDKQFAKTYDTWKHKPKFKTKFSESSSEIVISVTTTGKGSSDNPYPFVERGTSVRYATMTPDFSPKSQRGIIGSGPGSGGVLFINKNIPRDGIEAREFEDEIKNEEDPKFKKRIEKAMDEAAKVAR